LDALPWTMNANEIVIVNNTGKNIDFCHAEIVASVIEGRPISSEIADVFAVKVVILEGKDRPYRVIVEWA
jgi:hypothetical protein